MKKNYQSILSLILIASISFVGCKKTQEDYTSTAESAESFAQDQPLIFSSFDMIDDFLSSQNFMQKNGNPIIPTSIDSINYIDTLFTDGDGIEIRIVFPQSGILCGDGITRAGTINIKTDKPYNEVGSKTNITIGKSNTSTFMVAKDNNKLFFRLADDKLIPGEINLERINTNIQKFDYKLSIQILLPNSSITSNPFSFTGSYTIEKVIGINTPDYKDDELSITGNGKGHSWAGEKNYTISISEALYKTTCAKIFTKGKLTLQNEGSDVKLEINFGDGTCDSKIEVKSGAFKKEITL